jgi:hypothetical protein
MAGVPCVAPANCMEDIFTKFSHNIRLTID